MRSQLGAAAFARRDDVEVIGTVRDVSDTGVEVAEASAPVVIVVDAPTFLASSEDFLTECFGPLTVVVRLRRRTRSCRQRSVRWRGR